MEIFRPDMKMNILSIYLKGVSFEVFTNPADGASGGKKRCKPNIDVELKTAARKLAKENYEIVLHAKITAEQDQRPAFQIHVKQAGVFEFSNLDDAAVQPGIYAHCPDILLPFVRQVVADLVSKGGFPQLLLGPVNFEEILSDKNLRNIKGSKLAH